MMTTPIIEEALMKAAEQVSAGTLNDLVNALRAQGSTVSAEYADGMNLLYESLDESGDFDPALGLLCIELAIMNPPDNALFRKILGTAARSVLPPYLGKGPLLKALGLRDANRPLPEVARRLRKLLALKSGSAVFLPESGRWGSIGGIDNLSCSVSLGVLGSAGAAGSVPLEVVLDQGVILSPGPELLRLIDVRMTILPAKDFRTVLQKRANQPVSEEIAKRMAQCGLARKLDAATFDKWFNAKDSAAAISGNSRRACDGRSLREMEILLAAEVESGRGKLSEEEAEHFANFFIGLKPDTAKREEKSVVILVTTLVPLTDNETRKTLFTPLVGKLPAWPKDFATASTGELEGWADIAARDLPGFIDALKSVVDEESLLTAMTRLPARCLSALSERISADTLQEAFGAMQSPSADLILWVWKNRKTTTKNFTYLLSTENLVRALSRENQPKAWNAAIREVRQSLFEKPEFQKLVLAAVDEDPARIAIPLHGALFFTPSERQSLLVKLARLSKDFADYLESGAGKKILMAGVNKRDQAAMDNVADDALYTSNKSHKALIKELDDIINVHMPENREALKTARAHGDFRENAEFDAAKERRNFLSRRRSELERDLTHIQPVLLGKVHVENHAVIGSTVTLRLENAETETYHLLGAWDGDPDRNYLSYRTRLGVAIYNHEVGAKLELPGGRPAVLEAVAALPQEIVDELDN